MIKAALFVFTGLVLVVFIFSLFIPSQVMTVRAVEMFVPKEKIIAKVSDLQQWKKWHPVFMEASSNIQISSPSNAVGATAKWITSGKENELKITAVDSQFVKLILIRSGEIPVENMLVVLPTAAGNAQQVEWRALTKLKWYPWEKFAGIFVDKMTGPGYEGALNNLKNEVEQH